MHQINASNCSRDPVNYRKIIILTYQNKEILKNVKKIDILLVLNKIRMTHTIFVHISVKDASCR